MSHKSSKNHATEKDCTGSQIVAKNSLEGKGTLRIETQIFAGNNWNQNANAKKFSQIYKRLHKCSQAMTKIETQILKHSPKSIKDWTNSTKFSEKQLRQKIANSNQEAYNWRNLTYVLPCRRPIQPIGNQQWTHSQPAWLRPQSHGIEKTLR